VTWETCPEETEKNAFQNVGFPNLWGRIWIDSLSTPESGPVFMFNDYLRREGYVCVCCLCLSGSRFTPYNYEVIFVKFFSVDATRCKKTLSRFRDDRDLVASNISAITSAPCGNT